VMLRLDDVVVPGALALPDRAVGIVAFAHGSGSGRSSPRNRLVASILHEARLGTLLFDLLTVEESLDRSNVFDIPLLAGRLAGATEWLGHGPATAQLPLGYFGASTGAAAALYAAAENTGVKAIVSRGGRPDLALPRLEAVHAPTLLIVGGADDVVLELNRRALEHLPHGSELRVIPGATHLFEEPGALAQVAVLARDWFTRRLC
jgi:putative phosphoribosyl transferase